MMLARFGSDDALTATARASAADVVLTEVRRAAIIYPVITVVAFCAALAIGFAYPEIARPNGVTPSFLRPTPSSAEECDVITGANCAPVMTAPLDPNGEARVLPRLSSAQGARG
jgi:hypothetical protein